MTVNRMALAVVLMCGLSPLFSPAVAAPESRLNYSYIYFENGYPTPLSHCRPQSEANVAARANPDLVVQTGYYSLLLRVYKDGVAYDCRSASV